MPKVLSEHLDLSAKALFIAPDGTILPDTMICSGLIPDHLGGQRFPAELLPLRLFKCRQWLWLVVPGLRNDAPTRLTPST
jgi:hypothetical protein